MLNKLAKYFSGDAAAVLHLPNFRNFLFFRFFMTMATLMQSVIVGWHLYSLTGSVLALGMIGLTEVIPQISVSLFAGHFVDILDRKKIITNTSLLLLLGSGILFFYSIPGLHAFEKVGSFPIYITFFITGLVRGILMPAHTALLGQLVPRELLANAATWNSANWHIAAVAGPAIGGLVYGFFGITPAYLTVFCFYLSSWLLMQRVESQGPVSDAAHGNMLANIREGISFVFRNQILLGAFSLDMFAVFFGGAVALLPVFASDVLHVGPEGLGFLRACPAIGAIIMSLFLASRPPLHHTGRYLFLGVAGFGLCIIGFALSRWFLLSGLFLLISGMCDNISVVIRQTILQLFTPEEMKGRVASVNSIFVGSSNELGAFESGVAARILGLVPSVIFGGAMTLVVVLFLAASAPRLRNLSLHEAFQEGNPEDI
ncbi:MAG: MFS transporter [Bacteroidales bacterium]